MKRIYAKEAHHLAKDNEAEGLYIIQESETFIL